ncbi:hypothetical protein KY366_04310 [Candidatus Woesearchaeota archaeon]|nr:hypothetical protein [Candidatus Woesearchaeota archaeon]
MKINKKAEVTVGLILLVLIILIFLSLWGLSSSAECKSNRDCGENSYCGSDLSCHEMPVIEKTVVQRSFTLPLLIICTTVIALAVIWKWETLFGKRGEKTESFMPKEGMKKETPETYYTSQFQYTAK